MRIPFNQFSYNSFKLYIVCYCKSNRKEEKEEKEYMRETFILYKRKFEPCFPFLLFLPLKRNNVIKNKKLRLLEKALIKETRLSREQISIQLSPSDQVAEVVTSKEKFVVLLSERSERAFRRGAFAFSIDGIESIKALKAKYIFFHSQDCCRGILMGTEDAPGNWIWKYYDEGDAPVWIFAPLNNPKVYFKRKTK